MKGKAVEYGGMDFSEFAGNSIHSISVLQIGTWFAGATSYMYYSLDLFDKSIKKDFCQPIMLPNGSQQQVMHSGTISLSPTLKLHDILHIPNFMHNLLLVSKLGQCSNVVVQFNSNHCTLQD